MNDTEQIILDKLKELNEKVDKISEQNERIARLEEKNDALEERVSKIEKKMNYVLETVIGAVIVGVLALLF